MELGRILLYSADELWRYVPARLKYRPACYSSSKLQWSGGILRCLNGMDCCLVFPVVSVRLLMVSEHRWLTLVTYQVRRHHRFEHRQVLGVVLQVRPNQPQRRLLSASPRVILKATHVGIGWVWLARLVLGGGGGGVQQNPKFGAL